MSSSGGNLICWCFSTEHLKLNINIYCFLVFEAERVYVCIALCWWLARIQLSNLGAQWDDHLLHCLPVFCGPYLANSTSLRIPSSCFFKLCFLLYVVVSCFGLTFFLLTSLTILFLSLLFVLFFLLLVLVPQDSSLLCFSLPSLLRRTYKFYLKLRQFLFCSLWVITISNFFLNFL